MTLDKSSDLQKEMKRALKKKKGGGGEDKFRRLVSFICSQPKKSQEIMGLLAKNGLHVASYGLERNPGFCFFRCLGSVFTSGLARLPGFSRTSRFNLSASASRGKQLEAGSIMPVFKVCLGF